MVSITERTTINSNNHRVLALCAQALKEANKSAQVVLYGSYARGDYSEESDIDLLVLIDEPVTLEKENHLRRELFPIEIDTGYALSLQAFSLSDWNTPLYQAMPFVRNVEREGILL
jgi:predicted nucleotidyltransferase